MHPSQVSDRRFLTRFFLALACAAAILLCILHIIAPRASSITEFSVVNAQTSPGKNGVCTIIKTLPFSTDGGINETRRYSVELQIPSRWSIGSIHLKAESYLNNIYFNNHLVYESDHVYPIEYDVNIRDYFKPGTNVLEFEVHNVFGKIGFDAWFNLPWRMDTIIKSLLVVSLAALALLKLGALECWPVSVFLLTLGSLLVTAFHYFESPFNLWTNDVQRHIEYIQFIAVNGRLPLPTGWQTQQPPLYYIIAALFYKTGMLLGVDDPVYAARLLSMLIYFAFLCISIETIQIYLKGPYVVLASAMVLFWPSGFSYAARISNDLPMLLLNAIALYMVARWYLEKKPCWLRYAWYSALIGFAVKSSAVVGLGFAGGVTLLELYHRRIHWRFLLDRWLWAIGVLSLLSNFGRIFYYKVFEHLNIMWMQNIQDPSKTGMPYVKIVLPDFVYFNVTDFIKFPFYLQGDGEKSIYFWNPFFKTLLYGDWVWNAANLAVAVNVLFLVMLLYIVCYMLRWSLLQRGTDFQRLLWPVGLMMGCMTGALIASRVNIPVTAQSHARYIFGIIVPIAIYMMKSLEWHWQEKRVIMAWLGTVASVLFCVLSFLMIVLEMKFS